MKAFITFGTIDFLEKMKKANSAEEILLLQSEENSMLYHETEMASIFKEPKRFEVLLSKGTFPEKGFTTVNYIPVTEDSKPIFEHSFKNEVNRLAQQEGFIALRFLRPIKGATYTVLTVWENELSYTVWHKSEEHKVFQSKIADQQHKIVYPSPAYVKEYYVVSPKE
ncbi:antibiotic biosynthesis monooxygenase [Cytobacillus suaedae]|nr:antibiotic biosynthesis monooxygenase [Cytobacillus suaedae]